MNKRVLSFALSGFLVIIFINWSCTKLDTTTVGSDLIPAVDNITTFADTLSIISEQGIFQDSTELSVSNTAENYAVGKSNDPLLGGTDAKLYFQLKPGFYPYYIGQPKDTIVTRDSIVLCISFKGVYGDTLTPMFLQAYAVSLSTHGEWDSLGTTVKPSLRDINYAPATDATPISAPVQLDLAALRMYKKLNNGDSVINQIRIKLDNNFRDQFFQQDSLPGNSFPHTFGRDTLFRNFFNNGFGITMTQGNALLYTQLNDAMTRLEIHYTKKNGGAIDTSMSTFVFNNGSGGSAAPRRSAAADNIVRTRPALPSGDQEILLQAAPGTFAKLKIPQLTGYSNRIIHRAEIVMEQLTTDFVQDGYFSEPRFLYLDLVDTGSANRWKPIYHDLNPSIYYNPDDVSRTFLYYPYNDEVDFTYFGGVPKTKTDAFGVRKFYTINISRYVQQLVTKQTTNYALRLFAPHNFKYPQYEDDPTTIPYVNNIGYGRVKLAGGNNSNPALRMRLRVIYSKIN